MEVDRQNNVLYYTPFDQQKVKRPTMVIVAGVGKTFCDEFYIGLETMIDFMKSRVESIRIDGQEPINSSHDSDSGYITSFVNCFLHRKYLHLIKSTQTSTFTQ
jgi:hypothetical protein